MTPFLVFGLSVYVPDAIVFSVWNCLRSSVCLGGKSWWGDGRIVSFLIVKQDRGNLKYDGALNPQHQEKRLN